MVTYKLIDIVKQFMVEKGLETEHGIDRFLQFGIDAIRELHMDVSGPVSWKMIDIDEESQTAPLPNDCIRPIQVAKLSAENNPIPLILDNDIVLNNTKVNSFRSHVFSNNNHGYTNNNSGGYEHRYGNSAIYGSSYRIDHKFSRLKVSSDITQSCLYLEYLADVTKVDGGFMVAPYEREAVKSYIRWADVRSREEVALSTKQQYENYWYKDKKKAERRTNSITLTEWVHTWQKGLTGAPYIYSK